MVKSALPSHYDLSSCWILIGFGPIPLYHMVDGREWIRKHGGERCGRRATRGRSSGRATAFHMECRIIGTQCQCDSELVVLVAPLHTLYICNNVPTLLTAIVCLHSYRSQVGNDVVDSATLTPTTFHYKVFTSYLPMTFLRYLCPLAFHRFRLLQI